MTSIDDSELSWHKSAWSAAYGACVEVATAHGVVFIRDSKDPDGPRLELDGAAWATFVAAARNGDFDVEE